MLNLTFLFETCGKTEIRFIQLCEDKCCVYLEEGSLESGQSAQPCCLTRLYTVGCSDTYFDFYKIYNGLLEN